MFDWNDEELSNIIWGETGESDDHIVPYPEATEDLRNKKEWNQEAAAIKLTEQKRPEAKIDFHNTKLGSSSNLENNGGQSASGFSVNSWPDLSLSSAATTEQGPIEASKTLSKISKFGSSREETGELEKDAEIFQSANEGKEQSDFVEYGWANVGSFDDFDKIFSNDDPIFGNVSLDNGNELWPSKDETKNSAHIPLDTTCPSGASRNRSDSLEIKAEYIPCDDQSFGLSYEKLGGSASFPIQNAHAIPADVGYAGARSKPSGMEQQANQDMTWRTTSVITGLAAESGSTANEVTHQALGQKNLLKVRKKPKVKQEGKVLQDFYGNWSSLTNPSTQFENQLTTSAVLSSPSPNLAQQRHLEGAESLYQNIMNPYLAPPFYGNLPSTYPAMPVLSQAQPGVLRQQPLLSGYEASPGLMNPVKKFVDSVKPLVMTPQEKIEKLRRRQQMQAMLAIQKQQKQLGHQVPCTNNSITQKCPLEIQRHPCDGTDPEIEDLSTLPSLDPPIEQDDSNTMSVAVDYFVEDTVLYRLQDIISKLDIKIRLCIRDSLFRLAQSAMQRHYASDTSSTNKNSREDLEAIAREDRNNQSRKPDVETETNPIDRTVAHLLFHRPLELTGNHSDKLDSSISAKIQSESKTADLENLPVGCMPEEGLKSNQQYYSHQGFKNSCSLFKAQLMDQFKNSPCIETSENASNNDPADVGAQELEASQ